jgi:hypothetical protein
MKYQKDPEKLAKEWAYKRTQITSINDTFETIAREAWLAGNTVSNQEWYDIADFLPDIDVQVLVYGKSKSKYEWKVQPAKLKKNWNGWANPFEPEFVWEGYDIIDHDGCVDEIENVTYWMPMPTPPGARCRKL